MKHKKKYKDEEGKCPCCGHTTLDYGTMEIADGFMIYYPWTCSHCGAEGQEWYGLSFNDHIVLEEDK